MLYIRVQLSSYRKYFPLGENIRESMEDEREEEFCQPHKFYLSIQIFNI